MSQSHISISAEPQDELSQVTYEIQIEQNKQDREFYFRECNSVFMGGTLMTLKRAVLLHSDSGQSYQFRAKDEIVYKSCEVLFSEQGNSLGLIRIFDYDGQELHMSPQDSRYARDYFEPPAFFVERLMKFNAVKSWKTWTQQIVNEMARQNKTTFVITNDNSGFHPADLMTEQSARQFVESFIEVEGPDDEQGADFN